MKRNKKYLNHFIFLVKLFFPALLILFILRGFLLIPVRVDGNSMSKTLVQGDMVLIEKISPIRRFDVIIFKLPNQSIYIKRIIGLPGDTIYYKHDQLYVNDHAVKETFLFNNKCEDHALIPYTTNFTLKDLTNRTTIPKKSYFVLGDNRRMSKDSRSFGTIKSKYIIGKARCIYYPLHHFKLI